MSRRRVSLITCLKLHVPKGTGLLVAVSGGKDSVALLDGLVRIRRMLNLRLEVAHVDHGLRASSSADADFVEQLARKYEINFHKKCLVVPTARLNIENWGRKERYAYFKLLLDSQKLDYIVTAHHSDDVAETFLMRLVSNKELRSIHARNKKYRVVRPLLNISRAEIEKYVVHNNLSFREDESNSDPRFLRNKVRKVLIPFLRANFHARTAEWISERALVLDRDSRSLEQIARKELAKLGSTELDAEEFVSLVRRHPSALNLRIIELALLERLGFRLGRSRAEMVRKVILGRLMRCSLPDGYCLSRKEGKVLLEQLSRVDRKS